jgi:hypothetical protein
MTGEAGKLTLKTAIKEACLQQLQVRINNAAQAIEEARQSANNQEKSSAGDKYETARAMGQLDQEMNARQLALAREEYRLLEQVPVNGINNLVIPGTVIELEDTVLFAAIGLPPLKTGNTAVIPISCKSPLFQQLKFKKAGDTIWFGGKEQKIFNVF